MAPFPPHAHDQEGPDQLQSAAEFLETNGLGDYACARISGARRCPPQGLMVVSKSPPRRRFVLLNGFGVRVIAGAETFWLGEALPGTDRAARQGRLLEFASRPWPVWRYRLGDDIELEFECLARQGSHQFVFAWQLSQSAVPLILRVRPLVSGRPADSTRAADQRLELRPQMPGSRQFVWKLRAGAPALTLLSDGSFAQEPEWIRGFALQDGDGEDLASPGEFEWTLQPRDRAHLVAAADGEVFDDPHTRDFVAQFADKIRKAERTRRRLFRSGIDRAADQYVAWGQDGATMVSGFPGGLEEGASAMICVRGIVLSPGRLDLASEILATWRGRLVAGLLPETLCESQDKPVYGSPVPGLWYVVAAYEYIRASYRHGRIIAAAERAALESSIRDILGNLAVRRHRRAFMDEDGLIFDASPPAGGGAGRLRKRAHVQALWLAALRIGNRLLGAWDDVFRQARAEFPRLFWNPREGCLYESIEMAPGGGLTRVASLSPSQILAAGGLPIACLGEDLASLLVEAWQQDFLGPDGCPVHSPVPWQFGAFIEAWYRVHHRNPAVRETVLSRFIAPWERGVRNGTRIVRPPRGGAPCGMVEEGGGWAFAAAETTELLRILHLPELITGADPFDDELVEPLFYDSERL